MSAYGGAGPIPMATHGDRTATLRHGFLYVTLFAMSKRGEPPMRRDFQRLADLRALEAGVLAKSGNQEGAYYLGGYAVECALKACISRKTRRHEFPPNVPYVRNVYSHELSELLKLADLEDQLDKDMKQSAALAANWGTVKNWSSNSRYATAGLKGKDLYAAVTGADGVLAWIKRRW